MSCSLALVLYVLAAWWISTGAILFLGRLSPRSFRWSLGGATVVLAAAVWALHWSRNAATALGACVAFGAAILVWGWIELSFLLGAVTGPRRHACAPGCQGRGHFWHAVQAILYHELATLAALIALAAASWRAPNAYALWTFLLLWSMRVSAKLNLHFGVPNVAAAMLPPHLHYLASFFRQQPMSRLYPLSATIAAGLAALLARLAWSARFSPFQSTGLTLLAALATLGFLEHVMLTLSLPADTFWSWMRRRAPRAVYSEL
jgi:putative photosynthetic complex assembly protein 2